LPSHSPLSRLLKRAREREFTHLAIDKVAFALAIVMGGVIALLLAGTDILDWYWLVLLGVVSLGAGAYQLRKSLSSRYVLAQRIDQKLVLADAISTAVYFAENPEPEKAAICESQRKEAETLAAQVDVRTALPFTRSRYFAPAVALAAVAFGLFGLRYLVTGTLDLKASLVRVVYDNFFSTKTNEARSQLPKRAKFDPLTGNPNPEAGSLESDRQPEDLLDSENSPDTNGAGDDNSKTASQQGSQKQGDNPSANQGKEDQSGKGDEAKDQNGQESKDGKNGNANEGGKQGGKPSANKDKNQSLLDKVKDAVSSLMDKMKPQSSEGSKGDQSSQSNSSDQKHDESEKGPQSKDQQSQASANSDQGQQADGKQPSDANNDKKASDKAASQDSKNGIGSQDGEKALKMAEQLQAMGKISEILGKRSATVTGEVMVEVGSSKQQLKTPWAQSQASHSNAGGEIHRDEIPLTEQQFVERYFEEIHKPVQPPANGPPAKKSGDS
jgi:hypothetical protein